MRIVIIALVVLGLAGSLGSAQLNGWFKDNFNDNKLDGWKLDKGLWTAANGQAVSQNSSTWQYATVIDASTQVQDCCVQCDVIHSGSGLDFGGVAVRVNDPTGGTLGQDLIMVKLQGSAGFNQMWLYAFTSTGARQTGVVSLPSTTPYPKSAKVRLTVIGKRVLAEWDSDGDGTWDKSLTQTTNVAVKAGPVGLDAYSGALCDNFEMFNAALMTSAGGPKPIPGATVTYDLGGPANQTYLAGLSLGNAGVSVSATRSIPLTADGVFFASVTGLLGKTWGTLSNTGTDTLGFTIPSIPALVGVTYYTAYVTYDKAGITAISNDVATKIL